MPQFVNLLFLSEALWPLPCGSSGYLVGALHAKNFDHTVFLAYCFGFGEGSYWFGVGVGAK